jgi:hypothetical protein
MSIKFRNNWQCPNLFVLLCQVPPLRAWRLCNTDELDFLCPMCTSIWQFTLLSEFCRRCWWKSLKNFTDLIDCVHGLYNTINKSTYYVASHTLFYCKLYVVNAQHGQAYKSHLEVHKIVRTYPTLCVEYTLTISCSWRWLILSLKHVEH